MVKRFVLNLASFIRLDKVLYDFKRRNQYATVLSLHRISDDFDYFWPPIRVRTFKMLLEYCSKNYEVTHLADLKSPFLKKPKLVLSFDDGYVDFIENALPELVRLGLPSNQNVVIDCAEHNTSIWTQDLSSIFSYLKENKFRGNLPFGNETFLIKENVHEWRRLYDQAYYKLLHKNRNEKTLILNHWKEKLSLPPTRVSMMRWDQVRKCQEHDVEVGSHTVTHHTLPSLDHQSLYNEINLSKQILEEKLNTKCNTLALPNGQYNDTVLDVIRDAKYERVLLVNDGYFDPQAPINNPLAQISRINMVEETVAEMKLRMEGFHQLMKHGRIQN